MCQKQWGGSNRVSCKLLSISFYFGHNACCDGFARDLAADVLNDVSGYLLLSVCITLLSERTWSLVCYFVLIAF